MNDAKPTLTAAFRRAVKERMEAMNLTPHALSLRAKVPSMNVYRFLSGESERVSLDMADALAAALEIDLLIRIPHT